jgi:hypothetical protein
MKNLLVLLAVLLIGLNACKDKGTEPEEPEIVAVKAERIQLISPFKSKYPYEVNYIIQSQDELNKIAINPPTIDFSKFTLLGAEFYLPSRCPFPPIYIEILKNTKSKKYNFSIEYNDIGICASPLQETFWYLIPKIEAEAKVEFERIDIGMQYKYDAPLNEKNTQLWASNTPNGVAKTVFKKGESVYVNYSFKNYTGKLLDWFQSVDGEFCNIDVSGTNKSYFFPEDRMNRHTLTWGKLKQGESIISSWKLENPPVGEYRVIGEPIRDFKFILFPHKELKITIEE